MFVSMDATLLFDNMPHSERLETMEEALNERTDKKKYPQFSYRN